MHRSTSSVDLRMLAERLRRMADATALREYGQRMVNAALDLERQAAVLESTDRGVCEQQTQGEDARSLTRHFGVADTILSV